jgi:hypothetical protein
VLYYLQVAWWIVITITPFAVAGAVAYLRTQFPSKSDLDAAEKRLGAKIDAHERRLGDGSVKLAELDKRMGQAEQDRAAEPSRYSLREEIAELADRVGGLEGSFKGLERQLATTNSYLHTIIEKNLK